VVASVRKAALFLTIAFATASPANADAVFPFTSLTVENLVHNTKDKVVYDDANLDDDYQGKPGQTQTQLGVFEGGKFLTWIVAGDFTTDCNAKGTSSAVALVYVPGATKVAPISCEGTVMGNFGPDRRILTGTYQTTTTFSGNILEFTGFFAGRSRFYDHPSDPEPTFDTAGSIRQHARFEIAKSGCRVLLYETESSVRVYYHDLDNGRHEITDKLWAESTTPATVCHVK
jgi:hypothetical protein